MSASVYVSYSWTAEKKVPVIASLGEACKAYGLDFQRDSTRLKHGDLIRNFMDEIGSSRNIIPIFSRPYFESEYCMYELLQVWRNGNFQQRIYPILVEKIRLDDADFQLELIDYWKHKAGTLQDKLNKHDLGNTIELQKRRIVYAEIYRNIGDLLAFISNMNITPLDQLQRERFRAVLERIGKPLPSSSLSRRADEGEQEVKFTKVISNQESKPLERIQAQRIIDLEKELELAYKKLGFFRKDIQKTADTETKFSIQIKIEEDIFPVIKRIQQDYAEVLRGIAIQSVTDVEAEPIVAELVEVFEQKHGQLVARAPDLQTQLDTILQELREQNKSASAKFKVALPIIPTLVSYELDLDTENFLTEVWGKIRSLLGRKAANPQ